VADPASDGQFAAHHIDGVASPTPPERTIRGGLAGQNVRGGLNDISPEDIETIEVIKGPVDDHGWRRRAASSIITKREPSVRACGCWWGRWPIWFRDAMAECPRT
jgi:hypothetical protein